MILLRAATTEVEPIYPNQLASGADLRNATEVVLEPGEITHVGTGLYINGIMSGLPEAIAPDVQIRSRLDLVTQGVEMVGGILTLDLSNPAEIKIPLRNVGDVPFKLEQYQKIAQLVMALSNRLPGVKVLQIATT